MAIRFHFPRLIFFIISITLFGLSLAACATPPATPTVLSGVAGDVPTGKYKVEMLFKTSVMSGNNDVTVKVSDAITGEPLRHTEAHLKVEKRVHVETVVNSHDSPTATGHESTKVDPHASPKVESHDSVKKNDEHAADAGHDNKALTAGSMEGEYVGQVNFPEAGEWWVTVNFEVAGAEKSAAFPVTANSDWGKFAVLSGFLSVNVAVVAAAAITKGKFVKGTEHKETRA